MTVLVYRTGRRYIRIYIYMYIPHQPTDSTMTYIIIYILYKVYTVDATHISRDRYIDKMIKRVRPNIYQNAYTARL